MSAEALIEAAVKNLGVTFFGTALSTLIYYVRDMSKSVRELSTGQAEILTHLEHHADQIEDLRDRIQHLERGAHQ